LIGLAIELDEFGMILLQNQRQKKLSYNKNTSITWRHVLFAITHPTLKNLLVDEEKFL